MRFMRKVALAVALSLLALPALAQDFIAGIPRHEALIIQGPTAQNADWFNVWAPGGGSNVNGNQQLTTDTLWWINPEGGADAWHNALATEPPIYNEDFTQMTVKLREGVYWSDGVEFTADDVAFTVQTQIDHPGMGWSAPFTVNVASIEVPDRNTVVFNLKQPNSRFHTLFTVRWNAAWIMPKHIFEKVEDPLAFNFNPPVSLSAYALHTYDKGGNWAIWKLRDDWQRTTIGMDNGEEPAVKYVVYRAAGNPDARVIEQRNHNLDVINDITPEAVPPTGSAPDDYFEPMQQWLTDFELDTGTRKIKPYDPNISTQLADLVRPTWGDTIPTDEAALKRMFGFGWWKQDKEAAAELLTRAGFTKQGNRWMKPDGTPFSFRVQVEGDAIPTLARAGTVIAQQWQEAGIDAKVVVAGPTHGQLMGSGDFDTAIFWTIETWGGHPDLSFFLESFHSDYIKPLGEVQPPRNLQRWEDERLDAIIEANRTVAFDSPQVKELGVDFLKLAVEEMPMIPLMAYNKFAPFDTTYWTGYPSAENPYAASGPNWSNLRYMIVALKPNPDAPKS
jgi:ABC-type transport system substrate-binding protein